MTHAKTLLTVALLMAGVAFVLFKPRAVAFLDTMMGSRASVVIIVGLVVLAITGFVIGFLLKSRRGVRTDQIPIRDLDLPEPPDQAGDATVSMRAADRTRHDADESKSLVSFAQDLLGATSNSRLREVIARHLPPLLGSRRVWISTRIKGLRQVIVAESPQGSVGQLLNTSGQQWTTFPLQIDRDVVGLLGVESGGGLEPHLVQLVVTAAPLIAQALNTVGQIETLREASLVDLLTGAATRREGVTRLGAEIKRAQRTGSSMAVLMLDLDRFKSINDRFGHAVGDAVLTEVGRTLRRTLRASDSRCRWGGEEFLIVLPETDLTRAQVVAAGLLRNVSAATVPTPSGPVGTSVSIGITVTRPGETRIEPVIRRADIALYRAKAAGRSCVRIVLGDRKGNPIGVASREEPNPTQPPRVTTLPFPDRRDPLRRDRRHVPGPGRRSTDSSPHSQRERDQAGNADDRRVQSLH